MQIFHLDHVVGRGRDPHVDKVAQLPAPFAGKTDGEKVSKIPIVVGSGVAPSNVRTQMELARGFIVGTSVKQDGNLMAPIDLALASELARARDRG